VSVTAMGETGTVMDPGIAEFERMAARHWQGTEQEWFGGWLLRASGGFTGRANSVLPTGDPGVPAGQAVAEVESWYSRRGLTPMFILPTSLDSTEGELDELLAGRGWTLRGDPQVIVMTGRTETVARYRSDAGIWLSSRPDADWLRACRYLGQSLPPQALPVLLSAPAQVFASVHRDGRTVATGRLSLAGGWAGLTLIAVEPDWRRAGLGLAVTAELAAQALSRGIGDMFLQVVEDNTAARRLYTRCGFTDRHRYHYRLTALANGAAAHGT
jgi:GNAT superfamily N-acetyltransferase